MLTNERGFLHLSLREKCYPSCVYQKVHLPSNPYHIIFTWKHSMKLPAEKKRVRKGVERETNGEVINTRQLWQKYDGVTSGDKWDKIGILCLQTEKRKWPSDKIFFYAIKTSVSWGLDVESIRGCNSAQCGINQCSSIIHTSTWSTHAEHHCTTWQQLERSHSKTVLLLSSISWKFRNKLRNPSIFSFMFGRGGWGEGIQLQHASSPLDITNFYTLNL